MRAFEFCLFAPTAALHRPADLDLQPPQIDLAAEEPVKAGNLLPSSIVDEI